MAGRYLTDMANVLRAAGLNVIEEPGWQTRARSSGGFQGDKPYAIMWHHTASNTTPLNDIVYMVRNSDSRPIGNLYLARNGDVHVLAAGAANTNGKGGPLAFSKGTVPLDLMNTHSIAIEAANDGVGEPWAEVMINAYFKTSNALAAAYGMLPSDLATHNLWAPNRKVDPAKAAGVQGPWKPQSANSYGTWLTSSIQAEALRRATPPEPELPPIVIDPEEDDMPGAPAVYKPALKDGTNWGYDDATEWFVVFPSGLTVSATDADVAYAERLQTNLLGAVQPTIGITSLDYHQRLAKRARAAEGG